MERLLVECAVRGTLIAGGTAVVLWAARIKAPTVLHAVWTGVVVSMLLLPLWTAWGPKASMPVLAAAPASVAGFTGVPVPINRTSVQSVDPRPRPIEQATPARTTVWNWRGTAMSIYCLVASVLLLRLASGTLKTRRLVRGAVLHDARLTSAACASPVTMGWLRPVVILPECWGEWSASQLDAVLAHERQNDLGGDPLLQ
jgi:beta-lactamase regulating signal transducer with metallopeptidase domain